MRVAYLGTSEFAVAVLERLAASEHEVALVVTRPDRRQGRGRKLSPPPVATAAEALGLPLAQPEDVHDQVFGDVDALVVCAFGALIKEPLLSAYEIFNVHPSLLPRWRGAAPIERAIMAGDTETGVAIMQLEAGLDSGPVYAMESVPIAPDDDYGTLSARLAERGAELLVRGPPRPPGARPAEWRARLRGEDHGGRPHARSPADRPARSSARCGRTSARACRWRTVPSSASGTPGRTASCSRCSPQAGAGCLLTRGDGETRHHWRR